MFSLGLNYGSCFHNAPGMRAHAEILGLGHSLGLKFSRDQIWQKSVHNRCRFSHKL